MTENTVKQEIPVKEIEQVKEEKQEKSDQDQNIVFIGQKPFMNYVTAVVTQFQTKGEKEVTVKARGKFISRAVDVSEVAAKRFLQDENIRTKDIKINSEEFENKEGKRVNVSTIDITLEKA
jgi:DNA-binding protein